MRKRITLREVAELAQVSVATVSRVAKGARNVSPEAAERVRSAAKELGFDLQPKNQSKVLGFLLCNRETLHPFHARLLTGAEAYCASRGYNLLFLAFRYGNKVPWRMLHPPEVLENRQLVTGVVVTGVNSRNLLDLLMHRWDSLHSTG